MNDDAGFTIVEALVAMTILAVASVGLIRVGEGHVDRVRGLQARAAARWVAENRLAELRLGGIRLPATVPMLGRDWRVVVAERPAVDPDLVAVDISVGDAGGTILTLRGFRDTAGAER